MMALLAARPLRRTNFATIVLGRNLRPTANGSYELMFAREETKNRSRLQFEFPDELLPALERFLTVYRPILLGGKPDHGRLWIGRGGRPLSPMAFHHVITTITKEWVGIAIPPHLFRDAVATSISIEDPAFVRSQRLSLAIRLPQRRGAITLMLDRSKRREGFSRRYCGGAIEEVSRRGQHLSGGRMATEIVPDVKKEMLREIINDTLNATPAIKIVENDRGTAHIATLQQLLIAAQPLG